MARDCTGEHGITQFHALWSNPCFEIWMLLHFGFTSAPMDTAECLQRIDGLWKKQYGRSYEKSLNGLFDLLQPTLPAAINACGKLSRHHKGLGNVRPSQMNPQTRMPELFASIGDFLPTQKTSNADDDKGTDDAKGTGHLA